MDLENEVGLLATLSLVFAYLGFARHRYGLQHRETARVLQDALADQCLPAAEKALLLRFFYGSLRWWFLPATLVAASVMVPWLCFFEPGQRQVALSSKAQRLLLRCLRLQLTRYPLIALVAGIPLLLWIALVGMLAALFPGARNLSVEGLVRILSVGLALLPE